MSYLVIFILSSLAWTVRRSHLRKSGHFPAELLRAAQGLVAFASVGSVSYAVRTHDALAEQPLAVDLHQAILILSCKSNRGSSFLGRRGHQQKARTPGLVATDVRQNIGHVMAEIRRG